MACRHSILATASCLSKPKMAVHLLRSVQGDVTRALVCHYSTEGLQPRERAAAKKYKLVVVGGGSGGCAVAAKFSSLGKECAVIEPNNMHYYQPIWTLVGAGLKGFQSSVQPMSQVLPQSCEWIQERAVKFDPQNNTVELASGDKVQYDYLVVAMGIQLDYGKVKGLLDALEHDTTVASNYHPRWVNKTFPALQQFRGGNAIFTFPNTPIKCAGAPQKIMYLADEFFRKACVRDQTKVLFNTSLGVIFGVKKYADALQKVIDKKDITVNYKHNLVEVDHKTKTALFEKLDDNNKIVPFKYDFLHVTPPMSSPDVLKASPLVNEAGWVDVHKHTLQHNKFPNIFGLGDCTSLPTSKTGAAVAAQCGILHKNLTALVKGNSLEPLYDGYTSCPLITSSRTCILAEFDYEGKPLETLPINQAKELNLSYNMKAYVMPEIYWKVMMKGRWNGPKTFRRILHCGFDRRPNLKKSGSGLC
ncbi:sulfide:quinone oxidoreductase, mitochondrial-like [Physella acuta]|uniref:sulfide:quinone oxidoreductase, mitochondrial-like n=1 Tax=Physella acuta TaxID=109671 RepID=UPI0027DB7B34|nr:sulfide:quinone oxidoreductase, mitochondrial-like [Physella acuta]XP_059162691.1 sulfide:quinone oxidoreductase, mitochondrial-like [Physella acuta]